MATYTVGSGQTYTNVAEYLADSPANGDILKMVGTVDDTAAPLAQISVDIIIEANDLSARSEWRVVGDHSIDMASGANINLKCIDIRKYEYSSALTPSVIRSTNAFIEIRRCTIKNAEALTVSTGNVLYGNGSQWYFYNNIIDVESSTYIINNNYNGGGVGSCERSWYNNNTFITRGSNTSVLYITDPSYSGPITFLNNIVYASSQTPGSSAVNFTAPTACGASILNYNTFYNYASNYTGSYSAGANDNTADPDFFDFASSDYRIKASSTCLDSGFINVGFPEYTPTDDIRGETRPTGSDIDRGAYEMQASEFGPSWTSTYPKLSSATGSDATFLANIDMDGTAFMVVVPGGATAPTSTYVKEGKDGDGTAVATGFSDSSVIPSTTDAYLYASNLTQDTGYDAWFVAESGGSLQASPVRVDFTSNLAPSFISGYPLLYSRDYTSAIFNAGINEAGVVYFELLSSTATAPDSTQIKAGIDGDGTAAISSSDATVTASQISSFPVTGLTDGSYAGWFIAQDAVGNIQASPRSVGVTILPKDVPIPTSPVGNILTDPAPAAAVTESSGQFQIMYLDLGALQFPFQANQLFKYWVDTQNASTVTDLEPGQARIQVEGSTDGVNFTVVKKFGIPVNPDTVGSFLVPELVDYRHVRIYAQMFSPSQLISGVVAYLKAGLSFDFA